MQKMHFYVSQFYFNLLIILHFPPTNQQKFLKLENNNTDINNEISYPKPLTAPTNFTLVKIIDGRTAQFKWNPLPRESEYGKLSGYKIQTWSEFMGKIKDFDFGPSVFKATIKHLVPFSINYVRLYGFTNIVDGPTTDVITFEMPEWIPGPVASFDAIPMSTHSIYLKWKRPINGNGIITSYHLYLSKHINKKKFSSNDSYSVIGDPWITGLKITNLDIDAKYRFTICAATSVGEGIPFTTEGRTEYVSKMPDPPNIVWHQLPSIGGTAAIKVIWQPDDEDHLGDEFLLAYREKGQIQWIQVESEETWDQIIVQNLKFSTKYELRVVVIDGEYARRSNVMIIKTAEDESDSHTTLINDKNKIGNEQKLFIKDTNILSLKKLVKCLANQLFD